VPELTTDDGRKLAWHEQGSGPPLLCHPGGPGCSAAYFSDQPELAAQRTLLMLDPRGTGDSDRPADPSAYDLEDYADDIEAVREHVGLEQLDLIGHSHGGFVAQCWAGSHPDRVGRLVLASTAPRFTDAIRELRMQRVASHQGQPYFEDAMAALQAHQEGRYANDEELGEIYRREWRLMVPVDLDEAAARSMVETFIKAGHNADVLRHFNEQVAGTMDHRGALGRVTAPTLVITGELDPFSPAAPEIADALPNSTLVLLPEMDHFPFLENDDLRARWSQPILEFLDA
jgi:proline iminopeptidase